MRRYDMALADLNTAIRVDPRYSNAYYERGNVYAKMGNKTEALKDYQTTMGLDPRGVGRLARNRGTSLAYSMRRRTTTRRRSIVRRKTTKSKISRKGQRQYYFLGGSSSDGYIIKEHKGGVYHAKGSSYMSSKKWYWGKRSGNDLTLFYPLGSYERTRTFSLKKLEKVYVSLVSKGVRTIRKVSISKYSKKRYTSTSRKSFNNITIRTEAGSAFFIDGTNLSYSGRLKQGKTYYGTVYPASVELYVGSSYDKKRYPIKGFATIR